MVLHLLGKKSWNVYNSENVERVRRDEAEATSREEAAEQRMQEEDAARRIAILRGEEPPVVLHSAEDSVDSKARKRGHEDGLPRKRRRLRGEDDTDRDIRYAREDAEAGAKAKQALVKRNEDNEAPLQDRAGHISLIPAPDEKATRKAEKNAEVEAEKAKKRKRNEDQYTMRFSNAAGFKNGLDNPWYSSTKNGTGDTSLSDAQNKDVWGNEDPRRKEREHSRISSSDPFAAMQQAQRQLKQSEVDKEKWRKERLAEIEDLQRSEERRRRHDIKRRRRPDDQDSLEGFSLDATSDREREGSKHDRRHSRYDHRRRSRSHPRDKH